MLRTYFITWTCVSMWLWLTFPLDQRLHAGFEARGLIFGAPLASALGCAFVPLRKPGKLPGEGWGGREPVLQARRNRGCAGICAGMPAAHLSRARSRVPTYLLLQRPRAAPGQ